MYEALDSLILKYDENLKVCLQKVKPLVDALQPPLTEVSAETAQNLCKLFPPCIQVDSEMFLAELDVFRLMFNQKQPTRTSVQKAAKFAHESKHLFPTVYRSYSLLLTTPVSMAKDERTFSKLKIIKNSLRSK